MKSFNVGKQRGSCWRNNSRRSVTAMLAQAKHKNITHVTGTYSRAGSTTIPLVPPPLPKKILREHVVVAARNQRILVFVSDWFNF